MADTKISALTALDAFASGDLIPMVDDPSGTPVTKKATINQVRDYIIALANTWTATQTIDPADNTSALAVSGFSLTGSNAQSLIDLAGTWNTSGTPTAIKMNVTDTASNASSLLMDLQVGGSSKFKVDKNGTATINSSSTTMAEIQLNGATRARFINSGSNGSGLEFWRGGSVSATFTAINNSNAGSITWDVGGGVSIVNNNTSAGISISSLTSLQFSNDALITRRGAANLRLGATDAASPVAQTLSVQSVVAGTTNTAGQDFTITGSQGTGTGAGGSIIFQVAPAGSSGTAQNALVEAFRIQTGTRIRVATASIGGAVGSGFYSLDNTAIGFGQDAGSVVWGGIAYGGFVVSNALYYGFGSSGTALPDLFLTRRGAANLRLGAADAAAPVAQTLSVQSVVAGTTNTAGQDFTITGSQGTGTGAGGSIIFQVAPAGSSGTAQNALVPAFQISTLQKFYFGNVTPSATNYTIWADGTNTWINTPAANGFVHFGSNDNWGVAIHGGASAGTRLSVGMTFGWTSSNPATELDTILARDAANTLALRNGTNAQRFNIYGTYTSSTNYERLFAEYNSAGTAFRIGTEKGSGGGTARALELQTDGTTRLTISAAGDVTVAGLMNISSSGIRASSTGYGLFWSNSTTFNNRADGVLTISNYAENGFGRLQFGGTTSSFPALKRSTTSLQVRLADDSGYTNIQGKLTTETAYTAGAPTATGYIVLYDSTGTAYKVPAEAL